MDHFLYIIVIFVSFIHVSPRQCVIVHRPWVLRLLALCSLSPRPRSAFRRALHVWGIDMSDYEFKQFWHALDKNKDHTLTFSEFCKVASRGNAMPDSKVRPLPQHCAPILHHDVIGAARVYARW